MAFRLPTHLESFIPPPSSQVPQSNPWRGTISVSGMRASDRSSNQELRITAVETDGDNRADLWPTQFFGRLIHERPVLRDVQAWVKHHSPPLCTFMPDRLRDLNSNTVNQTNFRSLSRMLFENQTVVIAPWAMDGIPGAGIIIYPAQNSSALLVGALFLTTPFPEFLRSVTPPMIPAAVMQSRQLQYQHSVSSPAYAASHRNHTNSVSPHSHTNSPIEQPSPGHTRQDQYRYTAPRGGYTTGSSSSANWPDVKNEDNADYANFSPNHGSHHYP